MSDRPAPPVRASTGPLRRNVPVVTVEGFFEAHGEQLQLKLEGKRVGFDRKIREPTINRPGLALSGFYNYFAEKRVQVLGRGGAILSD
jgi:HPr kinase/phosphorylase